MMGIALGSNCSSIEEIQAVDPSGWLRRLDSIAYVAIFLDLCLRLSQFIPEPIVMGLFCFAVGVWITVRAIWRSRSFEWWKQRPVQQWARPIVQLPLTVDAGPVALRIRRSIGLFAILLGWFPTMLLAFGLLGTPAKPISVWENAGLVGWALLAWAIAVVCLRGKHGQLTLSEQSFSLGDEEVGLTSQTTCTFATRHILLSGNPRIEINSGNESIIFDPKRYYSANASVSGYGNGSQLIQALGARCHGGNAKAWLITVFPTLPTADSEEGSARLHPAVTIALGLLGLLALLLTVLMVSLGLK